MTDDSATGRFTIVNVKGLHARAAMKLVQLASKFPCEVSVAGPDGQAANAKSVMGVLLLCGGMGARLTVRATGADAEDLVRAMGELIANRFGEEA